MVRPFLQWSSDEEATAVRRFYDLQKGEGRGNLRDSIQNPRQEGQQKDGKQQEQCNAAATREQRHEALALAAAGGEGEEEDERMRGREVGGGDQWVMEEQTRRAA